MSPAAAFHAQLASIMEVLANTAVAEICELVDGGYAVLQLEISRSRKENETLRRKLRLMELRAARASALRAMATANGSTLLLAGGRARASLAAHHPGNEPRRSRTPGGEVSLSRVSPQETLRCRNIQPSSDSRQETTQQAQPAACESAKLTTAVIKVEDDDESWSQSEQEKDFCHVIQGQQTETEAAPLLTKQEVIEDGGTSLSWTDGDISSNTSKMPESSDPAGYDCVIYEPQVQHGSCSTQNPMREDPGCSYMLNTSENVSDASDLGGNFSFAVSEVTLSVAEHQQPAGFQDSQQRAPLPADEPQLPVRKEMQHAYVRRDGWRRQDSISREDSSGKAFVCNCCGKTLACLKNLKTHMRVHTGEKPFVCALCGKRFSDSSNLKRHQSVHTGEKRYGCVHCGKRFAQSGSLKVHMTVHTDCKQFRCSYCGKTFISGSHLRRHITVHAGEKRFAPTSQ